MQISFCCHHCGQQFSRSYGVDIQGRGTMYCPRCGKSQNFDLSGGWIPLDDCECGGTFSVDALGCCPNCDKLLDEEDKVTPSQQNQKE